MKKPLIQKKKYKIAGLIKSTPQAKLDSACGDFIFLVVVDHSLNIGCM